MRKVIFVDRDGTILCEPADEQIDSFEKMEFVPGAISALRSIAALDYDLVLASNQDGLGTPSYPEEDFYPTHRKMLSILAGEGVVFADELIDRSFPEDNAPTRKPRTGMFGAYLDGSYDLSASFVIGDRDTDEELARNLGCRFLRIDSPAADDRSGDAMADAAQSWARAAEEVRKSQRCAVVQRKTAETDIYVEVDLDGRGESAIDTGLKFFDHMLDQLVHHGGLSLKIRCKGDLQVDEHHTMEDVGIALGEALLQALGNKAGIARYGFALPMDESEAQVLLDLGGRCDFAWEVPFTREYVGDTPTEMFKHFFKSLSDALHCNLHIKATGENNHHLIEGVFKAFARTLRQAVSRNVFSRALPSSKGTL